MKKVNLLLLLLPFFSCSAKSETPVIPEKEAFLKVDTVVNTSIVETKPKAVNKLSTEYIYPTKALGRTANSIGGEDTLYAHVSEYAYSIAPTGEIREENTQHKDVKSFKLRTNDWVESAYLHLLGDKLLVYYTDTDGEGATSFVELINRKTGRIIYSTNVEGFNLGKPIIVREKSYVSAIGFVGKIDLLTGKYDWKYNNLYDNQKASFNSFDSVIVGKDTIEFISTHYLSNAKDKIIVADKTGQLLKVIK